MKRTYDCYFHETVPVLDVRVTAQTLDCQSNHPIFTGMVERALLLDCGCIVTERTQQRASVPDRKVTP